MAASAAEIQLMNQPVGMRPQADEDVICDKKEAMAYSRCHVREEQEEQQKREEWFGASPQDRACGIFYLNRQLIEEIPMLMV